MTYKEKQNQLFDEIENKFKSGDKPSEVVELVSNYSKDNRICLTVVVFLTQSLSNKINTTFIQPLRTADQRQYFYPPESQHITIQNIRTINDPPLFNQSDIDKTLEVLQRVVPKFPHFDFELQGLFELPTSLAVRAYSDERLKHLVLELRKELASAGIPDNKMYASSEVFFGNSTISRYTTIPNQAFLKKVKELKQMAIGQLNVRTISLITMNAVCHPMKTKILRNYQLKP